MGVRTLLQLYGLQGPAAHAGLPGLLQPCPRAKHECRGRVLGSRHDQFLILPREATIHPILYRIVAALALTVSIAATAHAQKAAAPPSEEVKRGLYLARVGDCVSCHSSPEGGQFGGGLRMNTSFGYLITPNITFDPSTGIGGWTRDDFWNALHNGQSKHGYYLYPVMPYTFFTKATRKDV